MTATFVADALVAAPEGFASRQPSWPLLADVPPAGVAEPRILVAAPRILV